MVPKAKSFFIHVYMHKILYTEVVLLSLKCHVTFGFHGLHRVQTGMNSSSLSFCSALATQQMPLFFPLWLNMLDG